MKKTIALITILALLAVPLFTVTSFGSSQTPEKLRHSWTCGKYASDHKTLTSFYSLKIDKKTFKLYDAEAGNPGIAGKMSLASKGKLRITCNSEDFDPPACWKLKTKDTLNYRIKSNDKIKLGHNGVWITFYRVKPPADPVPKKLRGKYICEEQASDQKTDTFYYALRIERKSFSLYDYEAGNPGIAGKMYLYSRNDTDERYLSKGKLRIICNTGDFDPPVCWKINPKARLKYRLKDKDTLKLGHDGVWLTFHRE